MSLRRACLRPLRSRQRRTAVEAGDAAGRLAGQHRQYRTPSRPARGWRGLSLPRFTTCPFAAGRQLPAPASDARRLVDQRRWAGLVIQYQGRPDVARWGTRSRRRTSRPPWNERSTRTTPDGQELGARAEVGRRRRQDLDSQFRSAVRPGAGLPELQH